MSIARLLRSEDPQDKAKIDNHLNALRTVSIASLFPDKNSLIKSLAMVLKVKLPEKDGKYKVLTGSRYVGCGKFQRVQESYERLCLARAVPPLPPLFLIVLVTPAAADEPPPLTMETLTDFWFVRLMLNLLGYATIFIPAALAIRYLKGIKYDENSGPGFIPSTIRLFVFGNEEKTSIEEGAVKPQTPPKKERTLTQRSMVLTFCFIGLQMSYLTWGVLQERIMTQTYGKSVTSEGVTFKNSQFLVFMNRILAFFVAGTAILFTTQPRHKAPLYKYSFSSFSNIMSSWFQYEALKYVSFPTQVLAKASKIIPVMLMGKIVSKKTYQWYEYITAAMISFGVSMFLLSSKEHTGNSSVTTMSGIMLLVGYMLFDSFTSNWQGELFSQYKMSSIQMMAAVNLFSCLFTFTSLIEQGGFFESLSIMFTYPLLLFHICLLSLCSATGQLFIFYTISEFGPVTFIIIMTMRQGFAIFLSCLIYHHPVSVIGVFGVFTVFLAIYLRIYYGEKIKKAKRLAEMQKAAPVTDREQI